MALEVNISKKFSGFHMKVEFEMDGGCLGILGASGCGKSMTLKCVAGIEKPDKGRIVLMIEFSLIQRKASMFQPETVTSDICFKITPSFLP